MKEAFFHIKDQKRTRILAASLQEFAEHEYDSASLDRIVERAEISKGGLYEYIQAKDDLYLFLVEQTYQHLYDYLVQATQTPNREQLTTDLLGRFRAVSEQAIDFYLEFPQEIALIVRAARVHHPDLERQTEHIFQTQFARLFADVSPTGLRFPLPRLMTLLQDLLIKPAPPS